MVTKELLYYIEDLRKKNISLDVIRNHLQKNNWTLDDVNQAFSMITYSQVTPPIKTPSKIWQWLTSTNTIVILLLSLLAIIAYNLIDTILFINQSTVLAQTEVYSIFDYSPNFRYLPFFYASILSYLCYLSIKTIQKARSLPLVGSISVLAITLISPALTDLISQTVVSSPSVSPNPIIQFFYPRHFSLFIPYFITSTITSLLFVIFRSKFSNRPVFNILHVLAPFIPFIAFSSISFIYITRDLNRLPDKDFGYTTIQKTVSYHVYRADPKTVGLDYTTLHTGNVFFNDSDKALQVVYDLNLKEIQKQNRIKATVLKQVPVDSNFDLFAYTTKDFSTENNQPVPVNINTAKNQIGYLVSRQTGNNMLNILTMVTQDNILLAFTSQWLTQDELVTLASSVY